MSENQTKKTLLVVEDDILLNEALTTKLIRAGYAVITANNCEDALAIALSKHPDLITLDILLPGDSGDKFMDAIRQDSWGSNVPIIILTNLDTDDSMIDKINKDHPSYYFIKAETDIQFLVEKIGELLIENNPVHIPQQTSSE